MVLTRATLAGPGADGVMGTDDDTDRPVNTTTSFVDQNQTYTSHSSHQVFLRQYELRNVVAAGDPVATGKLIEGSNGGMATWADVKAQAREMLGIELNGFPRRQLAAASHRPVRQLHPGRRYGLPTGRDAPDRRRRWPRARRRAAKPDIFATPGLRNVVHLAVRTGHAFLADIAHNAVPTGLEDGDITDRAGQSR